MAPSWHGLCRWTSTYNYYLKAMDAIHSVSRALKYPILEAGAMELLPFYPNKNMYLWCIIRLQ